MKAGANNNLAYNQNLQPVAIKLRSTATKAEACLWKYVLKAGQMKGYTFRRQRPVLDYVADFMCQPLKLIVEVDGSVHKEAEVAARDLIRQERLEKAGFTVLRFSNAMVLYQIEEVKKTLEQWIEDAVRDKSQ